MLSQIIKRYSEFKQDRRLKPVMEFTFSKAYTEVPLNKQKLIP